MSCIKCEEANAVNMPCDNCDTKSPVYAWAYNSDYGGVSVLWDKMEVSFCHGSKVVNVDFNKIIDLGKFLESSMMMDDLNNRPLKKSLDQSLDTYDTKFNK